MIEPSEKEPHPEPQKPEDKKKCARRNDVGLLKRPAAKSATADPPVENEKKRGQIISTVEYKSGWKIVKHLTQKGRVYSIWVRPSHGCSFSAKSALENGFEEEI